MPRVTRRRTIAAPVEEVWELVSDPYSLPRWWPRTSRVESVDRKPEGKRSQWTKVLETAEGRGVRADYRCVSSAAGERYVWEQQLAGSPFERHLRSSSVEIGLRPAERRHRGQPRLRAEAARDVALRLADDARRPAQDPRRGAGRPGAGADVNPRRDSKWWGWGDPAVEPRARRRGAGDAARAGRRARAVAARRRAGALRAAAGRAAAAGAGRVRSARPTSSAGPRTGVRHATGCGYADLARLRGGRLDAAPDAVLLPPDAGAVQARARDLRRRGRRRRPLRRRHQRRRRGRAAARPPLAARQPRPGGAARGRGRPALADRAARRRAARARGRSGAGRRGARPRPLPAVLRVRDDRRLRGDPLRRAGVERLRPLRLAGQLAAADRAGGRPAHAGDAAHAPRGRRCASSSSAPRGPSA